VNRWSRWWIVSILALWVHPAHAANWCLGTNLGLTVLQPKGGGDNLTTIGIPSGGGTFLGFGSFQPGLRLGVLGEGGKGEVDLDLGLSSLRLSGESINSFQGTLNLQRNFSPSATSTPYVTVGAGGLFLSVEGESGSNFMVGGGLGVQNRLSHGHGAVRGEVRFDYITEDEQGFVGGLVFGIKLGFDLWMH
jgi:hypothetical protein